MEVAKWCFQLANMAKIAKCTLTWATASFFLFSFQKLNLKTVDLKVKVMYIFVKSSSHILFLQLKKNPYLKLILSFKNLFWFPYDFHRNL